MKSSPFTLVGIVLALISIIGTGCGSSGSGVGTPEERHFAEAMEKANGDPSKLSPEDKKTFDEWIKKNPNPSSSPAPGKSAPGGSALGSSPGPGATR